MMASVNSDLDPGMHCVEGVWLPAMLTEDYIKQMKGFQINKDDIIVTGYPRTGNLWTSTTVDAILSAWDLENFEKDGPRIHNMDLEGWPTEIQQMKSPRVLWSHLRYHMLPEDIQKKEVKVIHITRDPRDAAVSYFYLFKMLPQVMYQGTWQSFFEAFMEGEVWFGSWFDYTKDWNSCKNHPNILFVEYEDFISDTKGMIRKLATFLGKTLSEYQVDRIASIVAFNAMQKNPKFNKMDSEFADPSKGMIIRSGKIGDWKNYFTTEQEEIFSAVYEGTKQLLY